MSLVGQSIRMWGQTVYGNSLSYAQFCCGFKTSLENEVYLFLFFWLHLEATNLEVGSQFPEQALNSCPLQWKHVFLNH